jgi:uncharacterized membrane protein
MTNAANPAEHSVAVGGASTDLSFSATLLPHRSLSRKGFLTLMLLVGAVSFICGIVFALMGAWPVFGFFGLDVVLIYIAFRINYRDAMLVEEIDLSEYELKVTRVHPSGKSESWSFNPYWVRLELREFENGADELSLTSHGRKLIFGAFLSDSEKKDFAAALRTALAAHHAPAA